MAITLTLFRSGASVTCMNKTKFFFESFERGGAEFSPTGGNFYELQVGAILPRCISLTLLWQVARSNARCFLHRQSLSQSIVRDKKQDIYAGNERDSCSCLDYVIRRETRFMRDERVTSIHRLACFTVILRKIVWNTKPSCFTGWVVCAVRFKDPLVFYICVSRFMTLETQQFRMLNNTKQIFASIYNKIKGVDQRHD